MRAADKVCSRAGTRAPGGAGTRAPAGAGTGGAARRYCLGIDIGTTAVKALLIDRDGGLVAEASSPHDLYSAAQGWAEEDAAEWWTGLCVSCRRILESGRRSPGDIACDIACDIAGVGISGMVPAIVLLDGEGRVLRRTIQQQDARTAEQIRFVQERIDQEELYRRTGSYTNQQHVLPRLLWVKQHEPEVWRDVRTVLGSYDYVRYRLTGRLSLETNWAVESALYDIRTGNWIPEYLAIGDLSPGLFPPVRRPDEVAGHVTPAAAAATGLAAGTAVVTGSADHVASALAAGVRQYGDMLVKFGGGGDVLFCTETLETHPRLYIDFHDIPGRYLINGCMAASGSLIKWFARQFVPNPDDPGVYRTLDSEAAAVPPGSDGVIVLPYFLGEKTPLFDPLARGVFFGLSLHHGRAHLFRAILEAVAYGFRHHMDELESMGYHPLRVFGTNGGAKSSLWVQIAADVLGCRIVAHPGHPGSALGAAFVAGMGAGLFDDWSEIERFLGDGVVYEPDPRNHEIYDRGYAIYRDLYRHLKPDFAHVSKLYAGAEDL